MSRSEDFHTERKKHLDESIGLGEDGYEFVVTPNHRNPIDGLHVVGVAKGDDYLGTMRLRDDGKVDHVFVNVPFRRQGHATRLWNAAKWVSDNYENFPAPKHSEIQTPEGKKWAKTVRD